MPCDLDSVFAALSRSPFRSRFRLSPKDDAYLRRRGQEAVLKHARDFLIRRLAPADPVNDGKQTPMRGHPAFVAQHATATCCRGCLAKWHGIPAGRDMTGPELDQALLAIARWLSEQPERERDQGGAQPLQRERPGGRRLL